jgi:hypothetical protein
MEIAMKRRLAAITMLLIFGPLSRGQGTKEAFDIKKSREELEIMKGILNTTLTFWAQNFQKQSSRLHFSNLSAFCLKGQGAVIIIPTSGLHFSVPSFPYALGPEFLGPEFNESMRLLNGEIRDMTRSLQEQANRIAREAMASPDKTGGTGSRSVSGTGAGQSGTTAAAPSAPPRQIETEREKLRKQIEAAQAKTRTFREEAEENRKKLLQDIADVKVHLIETLANHGDSITTVSPEEYINLVLIIDSYGDQKTRSDIISARKSWITDYKAGRLNMEGFKQKVVQYTE